jgi:phospholipid/cholesterol/gamma-HCH transport system ATP-binding protein
MRAAPLPSPRTGYPETVDTPPITVRDLTMAYGSNVVMQDITFSVRRGDICFIMGGSGCGKSTLLRHLVGLKEAAGGEILYGDDSLTRADPAKRRDILRRVGVLYQSGALWSALTLAENVAVPLQMYTSLDAREIADVVALKLALVGLGGFEDHYPSEISGGMQKRAGLARAMALDPEILCIDEPSAGLDPLSSLRLDELIRELSESFGTTIVIVSHELPSIFGIGTSSIFLDAGTRRMIDHGPPRELLESSPHPAVREFLRRGGSLP